MRLSAEREIRFRPASDTNASSMPGWLLKELGSRVFVWDRFEIKHPTASSDETHNAASGYRICVYAEARVLGKSPGRCL